MGGTASMPTKLGNLNPFVKKTNAGSPATAITIPRNANANMNARPANMNANARPANMNASPANMNARPANMNARPANMNANARPAPQVLAGGRRSKRKSKKRNTKKKANKRR